jgi:hypothetical protein
VILNEIQQFMIPAEQDKCSLYNTTEQQNYSNMKIMVVSSYRYKVWQTSQQLIENIDKDQREKDGEDEH